MKKLRDPRWQKRRLDIMNRDKFTCQICYSTYETLNVHHLIYDRGCDPWDYQDEHLVTLCEPCHKIQKEINIQKVFADLSINASSVITIGFIMKKIMPQYVNSPTATDQAIWAFMYDLFKEEFKTGDFIEEYKAYREQYVKW